MNCSRSGCGSPRRAAAGHPSMGRTSHWMVVGLFLLLASARGLTQSTSFPAQAVNSKSGEQSVPIKLQSAGAVSIVEVLTSGASGLDFTPGIGAMTCGSATLGVGATCTESVTFTPAYPGLRTGAVVLLDSSKRLLGTAYLSGTGVSGLGVIGNGNIVPVAGDGDYEGSILDGFAATSASLDHPSSVTLDAAGNMYIADRDHNRIRKVTGVNGIISTLAGNGIAAYGGDGMASTNAGASLNAPWGVALDGAGNLYIADTGNNRVREIAAATGIISTVAGTGAAGRSGDNGRATLATLNQPQGVSVDAGGNLYIADTSNHSIRRVDAVTGIITTVAGDGSAGYGGDGAPATSAQLNSPFAVAFDSSGNMYIPDSGNNVLRLVNRSGVITTFAGTGIQGYAGDGSPATLATLSSPSGVAIDPAGNVYIADTQNGSIRKVNCATGLISTLAGGAAGGYVYNNGEPSGISIYGPTGMFLDGSGDLYFADSLNMRIEEIQSNFGILDYTAKGVRQGDQSAPLYKAIENDGNAALNFISIIAQPNAALDEATTTCTTGSAPLAVNGVCGIGATFAPSVTGNPLFGGVEVVGDGANSHLNIELIGDATVANSTTTTLDSSPNPAGFGQAVIFIATVATGAGTGSLTGWVKFSDGVTTLETPVTVNSAGQATLKTQALHVGAHPVTASYVGDGAHFDSVSEPLVQIVLEGTSTTLTSSANPSAGGQSITFAAAVTGTGGGGVIPDGTVTFRDGSAILCTATLGPTGVATCINSTLANGLHAMTATYNGDDANQISGSISSLLNQDVLEPTVVAVTSTPNPSEYGSPVAFAVTVSTSGSAAPTGSVYILDGGRRIGTANLVGSEGGGTFATASLGVGSNTITAAYQGDASNGPSTSPSITHVVNQVQTSTGVAATPSSAIAGASIAITASVKAAQGADIPSGAVTFTDTFNGAVLLLGSASPDLVGTARIHATFAAGSHSIVAAYVGDVDDSASTSAPLALTAPLAATSIAVTSGPNPSAADSAATFTATVGGSGGMPTGTVTFLVDGTSIGASTLSPSGTAALSYPALTVGTHSITADYAGDENDQGSASPAISQMVGALPTVTSLAATATSGSDAGVVLLATVTASSGPAPTGSVAFAIGTTALSSGSLDSNGVATVSPNLAVGTYSIVAAYAGDRLHAPSTSQALSVVGSATYFNLTVTPPIVTMATRQDATVIVILSSVDNFADTIKLGCGPLPTGVTCHFSNPALNLAANSTQSAQLTIDTDDPLTDRSSAESIRPGNRSQWLAGILLPCSLSFSCLIASFRSRQWGRLSTVALLLLAGGAMLATGCTTLSQTSAPPGTYVIQVSGTGLYSNITHNESVTLNLTR